MNINDFDSIKDYFHFYEGVINGHEEYFQSAVLLLLIPLHGHYHFVFQKRHSQIRQGGQICFPGGKVDAHDLSVADTVLRETHEELGIAPDKIQLVTRLNPVIAPMGAIVDAYLGTAAVAIDQIQINQDEVESIFTIPLSYFIANAPLEYSTLIQASPYTTDTHTGQEEWLLPSQELGLPEMYNKPWGGFKHRVYVYPTAQGPIWGLTARLIYDCIGRIKQFGMPSHIE